MKNFDELLEESPLLTEENCCVFLGGLSEKEEESLSQFTGLLDKDGKEIYENSHVHCFKQTIGNSDKKYKITPSYSFGVPSPQMMPWDPRSSNLDELLEQSPILTIAVSCACLAFMLIASWFTYLIFTA
jgi:hypothetical protein